LTGGTRWCVGVAFVVQNASLMLRAGFEILVGCGVLCVGSAMPISEEVSFALRSRGVTLEKEKGFPKQIILKERQTSHVPHPQMHVIKRNQPTHSNCNAAI
jgi:hypothetical protein